MKYRSLGSTGLKVSEISLGSWLTFGGYVDNHKAIATIERAYELGINFFDTANVYNRGESEKIVGHALARYPRSSYILATKVRGPMGELPNDQGLSRKHIIEQCNASLKRLGVEYIDLYYCHYPDQDTPMEETLMAMDDLVRQGKVFYIGISNMSAKEISKAVSINEKLRLHPIAANQPIYNMFNHAIEEDVIPVCEDNGIGQVVYSPLAQGVLSGNYQSIHEIPPMSRASDKEGNQAVKSWLREQFLTKASRLKMIAAEFDLTLPQMALAWTLRTPNISSAIIGASRPEQVEENVRASGVQLSNEQWSRVQSILND